MYDACYGLSLTDLAEVAASQRFQAGHPEVHAATRANSGSSTA